MLIGACLPELIPGTEVPRGAVRNSGPHPGVFLPKTKAPLMLILLPVARTPHPSAPRSCNGSDRIISHLATTQSTHYLSLLYRRAHRSNDK